ncbi:MAG: TonB-dependent receptor, partial [Vicinamibacteraceae bacterium]
MRKCALVLLMAAVVALPAVAQEQRASIEGVVTDSSGAVLPGVIVEARSASGAVVSTVTNDVGGFRFPALAPGFYEVSATLEGFQGQKYERVEALLGQIKRLQFSLEVGGLAEQVQVTAETPLVDVRQSARATSIRAEQIERLPKGRDFSTLLTQAPGANIEPRFGGGISVDGASAGENRFIVDGMETTDLQMGTSGKQVLVDFIEELQVKSSGYQAEFGGATGGVINIITKSGTNAFHGTGLLSYEGSALSGGRYTLTSGTAIGDFGGGTTGAAPNAAGGRPTLRLNPVTGDAEYIEYAEDDGYRVEPGFAIGGPIVGDRAWFYAAYQPTIMNYERSVDLLEGGTATADQQDTRHFFTGNQTTQLSDRLRTRVAFNNSYRKRDGLLPALDGTDPEGAPYGLVRTFPNWTLSGTADWVASSNLYVGLRAGYYFADTHDEDFPTGPRILFPAFGNVDFPGVPAEFQRGVGFSSFPSGAAFSTDFDKQKRLNVQADATWYGAFGGQHQIKGGVQVDRIGNEVFTGEAGNRVQVHWGDSLSTGAPLQAGQFGYYQVRSNGVDPKRGFITEGNVSSTNIGLFIQDAWTIKDRLTINAGLRTERERVPAYGLGPDIPEYGIEFDFQDKLAPRVGMAWDMMGDGRWKTYASWGMFYDIFKLQLPRGSFGGDKWLEYYYTLDTYDWPSLVSNADCPPACSGTLIRGPIDFRHPSFGSDAIEPDLKPMRLQEAAVGLERQLTNVTAVGVRYLHKQIDRGVEDTGSLDAQGNEIYIIANPGEGLTALAHPGVALPKPKRDYDSVELTFDKRQADNWSLRLSYLWSRLHGNYAGLSQSDENGRTSPNVGRLFDYPAMMFDEHGQPVFGPLPTDRPHQFKAQGVYTFNFGTSVGVNYYIGSGVPVTRELGIYPTSNLPV